MVFREPSIDQERSILVVGIDGMVHGLDRETGTERWSNALGGYSEIFIALRKTLLVAFSHSGHVFRIDYYSGATLWAKRVGTGRATVLIDTDSIFVAQGGTLTCFDPDGNERWTSWISKGRKGSDQASLGLPGNVALADASGLG